MMTQDPLNELWNSTANRPAIDAGQRLASQFVARMRRRNTFQLMWLVWTLFAMTGITALTMIHLARNGLDGQWTLFLMLALPWFVTLHFLRAYSRRTRLERVALPLGAALAAARASNRVERRGLVFIGIYLAIMAPIIALAVWQLHAAGKASVNQAWSMAFVFGAILTLSAAGMAVRYRRYLLPEMRMIDALLRDLDAPTMG